MPVLTVKLVASICIQVVVVARRRLKLLNRIIHLYTLVRLEIKEPGSGLTSVLVALLETTVEGNLGDDILRGDGKTPFVATCT
jgi:hypothetical protein